MNNYLGSKEHKDNARNSILLGLKKLKELKVERIKKYYSEPSFCLCCDKVLSYEKKNNKFCSSSCSASYNNKGRIVSDEQKKKVSLSLSGIKRNEKLSENIKEHKRICSYCKKEFIVWRLNNNTLSHSKHCSSGCTNSSMKEKVSLIIKEKVKNGTHKGWQSRNIESYPEKFFKIVLENNGIKYKFNKVISKRSLGLDCDANYFLDFYLKDKNIDLEIDGKQHNYEDRIENDELRDFTLIKNGFIVYRIKWKEIQTNDGKNYIKNEIDKFLEFYNAFFA